MKKNRFLFVGVLLITLGSNIYAAFENSLVQRSFGNVFPGSENISQDRSQSEFEYMMSELQRVHKALYSLPYNYDYIKENLVVQVEAKKKEIAPHFPNRSDYGTDHEKGNQLFKEWYSTYPSEWRSYIKFLDQFIIENSK